MTGLATQIFYSILNMRADTSCERYFRYDVPSPSLSLESRRPLKSNHIIGFSLVYEQDILGIVQMLDMSGIPVRTGHRADDDPIVIVGGPVVSANPEPYVDIIDAFVIGEGDLVIHDIVIVAKESTDREQVLDRLSELDGVYVPSREQAHIQRLLVNDLDALDYPTRQVLPDVPAGSELEPVFGRSFLTEVTRGCGYSCRFCLIGHVCRPRRVRSLSKLMEIIEEGIKQTSVQKVSLIGSSLGDADSIESLASWIVNQDLELSVPSLRADAVTEDLLSSLVRGGQRTLAIAPETGSSKLREAVGKGLDDSDIERAVMLASRTGYQGVKLYFIVGLPGETDEDVSAIVDMSKRLAKDSGLRVTASVNPFVPKAHTRWEREAQLTLESIRERYKILEHGFKGAPKVVLETLDPRDARIQAALSVGGRTLGEVIIQASKQGGYGGWRRAERETGIPFLSIASDSKGRKGKLPWESIIV